MEFNDIAWIIEWERLYQPITLNYSIMLEDKPVKIDTIEIKRNEEYKLHATVKSSLGEEIYSIAGKKRDKKGGQVHHLKFSGLDVPHKYELKHCHFGNTTDKFNRVTGNSKKVSISSETELFTQEVVQLKYNDTKTEVLIEWYLNGPDPFNIFFRPTERSYCKEYYRKRDKETFSTIKKPAEYVNHDHLFIKTTGFSFIIAKVPENLGPSWSNNLAIEYSEDFGGIPSNEIRQAVSEILGFILGKQLLGIGFSELAKELTLLSFTATNPWGNGLKNKCLKSASFPFINDDYEIEKIEEAIGILVENYITNRNELQLNESLYRYWLAEEVPLGLDLPLFANGVEILTKRWLSRKENKIDKTYMKKSIFKNIISSEIKVINNKLEQNQDKFLYNKDDKTKIIDKIRNANNLSQNEQSNLFLNKIGLPIGEKERTSIWARNKMIHDIYNVKTDEWELVDLHRSYKTYFNRIFLKVLGYSGDYIDYTLLNYPTRNIDDIPGEATE